MTIDGVRRTVKALDGSMFGDVLSFLGIASADIDVPATNPYLAITQCPVCGVWGDRHHAEDCANG